MKFTWLGQSGYLIEVAGKRLLLDPFYSDIVEQKQGLKRLVDPPIPLEELRPDVIFITHNHLDHFDPIALPQIHRHFQEAIIVGPVSVMLKAKEHSFNDKVLAKVEIGGEFQFGGFKIIATPAYHSDPYSVGCLLEIENKRIYYSGDTLFTETLVDEVKAISKGSIDYLFIVINGKLGNMNVAEAIEVARLLQPARSIPMHYGMFAENTADPLDFVRGCDALNLATQVMELGLSIDFN